MAQWIAGREWIVKTWRKCIFPPRRPALECDAKARSAQIDFCTGSHTSDRVFNMTAVAAPALRWSMDRVLAHSAARNLTRSNRCGLHAGNCLCRRNAEMVHNEARAARAGEI